MKLQNMNIKDALETVEEIQKSLQMQASKYGDDVAMYELVEKQERANRRLESIENNTSLLKKVTGHEVRRIKKYVNNRVAELMKEYEPGTARKILHGNLQGFLYRRYNVNKHEDFLMVHYPRIQDDIKMWIPDGKTQTKLDKHKKRYEQQTLKELV